MARLKLPMLAEQSIVGDTLPKTLKKSPKCQVCTAPYEDQGQVDASRGSGPGVAKEACYAGNYACLITGQKYRLHEQKEMTNKKRNPEMCHSLCPMEPSHLVAPFKGPPGNLYQYTTPSQGWVPAVNTHKLGKTWGEGEAAWHPLSNSHRQLNQLVCPVPRQPPIGTALRPCPPAGEMKRTKRIAHQRTQRFLIAGRTESSQKCGGWIVNPPSFRR